MTVDLTILAKRNAIHFELEKAVILEKLEGYKELLTIHDCKERFVFLYGNHLHLSFNDNHEMIISADVVPQTFDKETVVDCLAYDKIPMQVDYFGKTCFFKVVTLYDFAKSNIRRCKLLLEDMKQSL